MRTKHIVGLVLLAGLIVFIVGSCTGPAEAQPPSTTPVATTPLPAVKRAPDRPSCTQEKFRELAKKIYRQEKISKLDHERLYQARKCLKHKNKALGFQRKMSAERRQRLDPWGYAWSKVGAGLKATLARVKHCESGGSYTVVNSSGHGGGYQYDWATWQETGGTGYAQDAPPREQDVRTARFFPGHESRWDASRHCWG